MDSHFFASMYRLKYIKRWSLMRNVTEENVAEHSFQVALLTHALCTIGNEIFNKQLDTDKAVTLALFHDATEMFTGDIPTPVKHHNPDILQNFRDIESNAAEKLVRMIPSPLHEVYANLLGRTSDLANHDELTKYVKAADRLDAYLKCVHELSAGNHEFSVAKEQIKAALKAMNLKEVDYFLNHFAPSFAKTIDEIALPVRSAAKDD